LHTRLAPHIILRSNLALFASYITEGADTPSLSEK
jgi:hypothetical protein